MNSMYKQAMHTITSDAVNNAIDFFDNFLDHFKEPTSGTHPQTPGGAFNRVSKTEVSGFNISNAWGSFKSFFGFGSKDNSDAQTEQHKADVPKNNKNYE